MLIFYALYGFIFDDDQIRICTNDMYLIYATSYKTVS
jgi:hypothetical protein